MKVRELIEELRKHDPEAEVHIPFDGAFGDTTEADTVYADTTKYGILTENPTTVPIVVLREWGHGL